eukprot:scaffold1775_cov94-Phaeocystis_antarctica.AAC.2
MPCYCIAAALVLGVPHPNVVQQRGLIQLAELSVVSHAVLICVVCQVHSVILGLHHLAIGQLYMHHTFVSLDAVDLAAFKGRVLPRPRPDLRGALHACSHRCKSQSAGRGVEVPRPNACGAREAGDADRRGARWAEGQA